MSVEQSLNLFLRWVVEHSMTTVFPATGQKSIRYFTAVFTHKNRAGFG